LQTGFVSVNREYDRDERGERGNFKHFVVSRGVTILQRDLQRFNEFLETLVSSTDMEAYFVLETSRLRETRAESHLKALRAAKEKAAGMAETLGPRVFHEGH
jgi:uncharacterized protein YggE